MDSCFHVDVHVYDHILTRGEAIMLINLSIILFSNSYNFVYYAHRFYLLFPKLGLVNAQGIRFLTLSMQQIAIFTNIFTKEQESFEF